MKRTARLLIFMLLVAFSTPGWAQMADPAKIAAQREHMDKLDWLVGEWQGSGWMMFGPGQRHEFNQREWVHRKLDGLLLTIEGLGEAEGEGVVHRAFAVVDYEDGAGKYRFTAYNRGLRIESEAKVGENRMEWGMRSPQGGHIRYRLWLTENGEWHEVGEFSPDGERWNQFFEMTLKKVGG